MKYKWFIKEHNIIEKDFLEVSYNSEVIARMLLNRGIDTVEKAKNYLYPEFYEPSKPEEIGDLVKAKDRILEAINKNEKIVIFGDYDVDGVTSTSCLLVTLKKFTDNVDFYIPSRLTEGYGLNLEAVRTIAASSKATKEACHGKPLLITCDCGITNVKEVELANELGMDVIITDHHSLPEILPPACAVLNPKFLPEGHKLHFLPGVGVAYKLAEAILKDKGMKADDLLDLVTLGMIADLAPLVDENRYLVQIGLPRLANTERMGLRELLKVCGHNQTSQVNADHVGFGIAPRINAVGRLTDANLAVKLMTTNDLLEATNLATELEFQNRERQTLCEETVKDVIALATEQVDFKNDKCIILAKEGWHHGVIGIVASRVLEKFSLPTLLICIDEEQNIARGSGRSISKLNIVEALVSSSTYLEKFGGHKAACGLSVKPENIPLFISDFKKVVNDLLKDCDMGPVLNIDSKLPLSELNMDLIEKINKLAPFGFGNRMAILESDEVEIVSVKPIGKNGQHLKLYVSPSPPLPPSLSSALRFEALIWNHDFKTDFKVGDKVKLAYTPKVNSFGGETFIQLEVKDFEKMQVPLCTNQKRSSLFDYRGKTNECLEFSDSVLFFAESSQKDFHPVKTFSRINILKRERLVFLDFPPDESTFFEIIERANAEKIYFAFSQITNLNADALLKRLIGMLRYVVNNKDSKISEIQLQSALGINKNTLAYSLKILEKVGFLNYSSNMGELSVNISKPSRQNYEELLEYNVLVSELRKIQEFHKWIFESDISEIELKLKEVVLRETIKI